MSSLSTNIFLYAQVVYNVLHYLSCLVYQVICHVSVHPVETIVSTLYFHVLLQSTVTDSLSSMKIMFLPDI